MNAITRREFLHRVAMLGLSASAVTLLDGCGIFPAPTPTPTKIPRIGVLSSATPSTSIAIPPFRQGLRDLGYEEGKNIQIEYRYAEGNIERLPNFAIELSDLKVDIVISSGAGTAIKNVNTAIPVVFIANGDPVGAGLVASLSHPGGNVTGVSTIAPQLDGKRLQILKETIPGLVRVGVLRDPRSNVAVIDWKNVQDVGKELSLQFQSLEIEKTDDFESAFKLALDSRAQAVLVIDTPFITNYRARIAELAASSRLPTSFKFREAVDAGGLMSYGVNIPDLGRRAATYVDKILKGAKPGDLPVEQPTKFDFVINLKTAKQLGLTIPQSVLAQATEVIQ